MPEPSKPARRKTRDDRIDWEELERAPNMKGMLSYLVPAPSGEALASESATSEPLPSDSVAGDSHPFFELTSSSGAATALVREPSAPPVPETDTGATLPGERAPSETLPDVSRGFFESTRAHGDLHGDPPRSTVPGATLPGERAPSETLPGVSGGLSESTHPRSNTDGEEAPRETLPGASLPSSEPGAASVDHLLADPFFRETPTTLVPGFGKRRFHRCLRVEDAHTAGEQLLLETLYRLARDPRWGQAEPGGAWLVTISMDELARHVRLHRTNVRTNLTKLRAKLAIDLVALEDVREQSSRTYRLYPPAQILARRQQAGLEWVVKNRSVSFVPAEMVAEAIRREMPPSC